MDWNFYWGFLIQYGNVSVISRNRLDLENMWAWVTNNKLNKYSWRKGEKKMYKMNYSGVKTFFFHKRKYNNPKSKEKNKNQQKNIRPPWQHWARLSWFVPDSLIKLTIHDELLQPQKKIKKEKQ